MADSTVRRIGFLGLGAIGLPIAERLAAGGNDLVVFDVRDEAMKALKSPAEVAASAKGVGDLADVVFGCLASEDSHRDALLGPQGLIHGSRVKIFINLGTSGADLVREIATSLAGREITTVDAPVTGGVGRALSGTLVTIAAGNRETVDEVSPLIRRYSNKIVWMGTEYGSAQVMKVVNNAVSYANLAAACEAMLVGAKAGLDPASMLDVLNHGSGQNSATLMKIPTDVLTGQFEFGGSLRIVMKDLKSFLSEADRFGVEPNIGQAVMKSYLAALELVSENGDVTEVIRPMEVAAGVELRSAPESARIAS